MTERYLVMLRGVNVGTRNRVPMAELRAMLADTGYSDVATVLQMRWAELRDRRRVACWLHEEHGSRQAPSANFTASNPRATSSGQWRGARRGWRRKT